MSFVQIFNSIKNQDIDVLAALGNILQFLSIRPDEIATVLSDPYFINTNSDVDGASKILIKEYLVEYLYLLENPLDTKFYKYVGSDGRFHEYLPADVQQGAPMNNLMVISTRGYLPILEKKYTEIQANPSILNERGGLYNKTAAEYALDAGNIKIYELLNTGESIIDIYVDKIFSILEPFDTAFLERNSYISDLGQNWCFEENECFENIKNIFEIEPYGDEIITRFLANLDSVKHETNPLITDLEKKVLEYIQQNHELSDNEEKIINDLFKYRKKYEIDNMNDDLRYLLSLTDTHEIIKIFKSYNNNDYIIYNYLLGYLHKKKNKRLKTEKQKTLRSILNYISSLPQYPTPPTNPGQPGHSGRERIIEDSEVLKRWNEIMEASTLISLHLDELENNPPPSEIRMIVNEDAEINSEWLEWVRTFLKRTKMLINSRDDIDDDEMDLIVEKINEISPMPNLPPDIENLLSFVRSSLGFD